MVVEELRQEAGGEGPHLAGIGRPHRGSLGDDQSFDERAGEAVMLEPISEREIASAIAEQLSCSVVEPTEIGDHPVKPRGDQVRPFGEQAVWRRAAVLEVADPIADAEAHRR